MRLNACGKVLLRNADKTPSIWGSTASHRTNWLASRGSGMQWWIYGLGALCSPWSQQGRDLVSRRFSSLLRCQSLFFHVFLVYFFCFVLFSIWQTGICMTRERPHIEWYKHGESQFKWIQRQPLSRIKAGYASGNSKILIIFIQNPNELFNSQIILKEELGPYLQSKTPP